MVAKRDALELSRLQIEFRQIAAAAPSRLTVVGFEYLEDVFLLFGPFLGVAHDEIVFRGTESDAPFGQMTGQQFAGAVLGIHLIEHAVVAVGVYIIVSHRARHPTQSETLLMINNTPGGKLFYLRERAALSSAQYIAVSDDDKLAVG